MEGHEISSGMLKVWRGIAASESRLELMKELKGLNVGFGDVENFNLDLSSKFRSQKFKEKSKETGDPDSKVVKAAMNVKLRDEERYLGELNFERNELRKNLANKYTKNSNPI